MTTALEFLESVLPDEGYKCAFVVSGDRKFNRFFSTHAELADFILREDALGRTTYHACAVFGAPDSRKGANALGAAALWLDVDCGDGKAYATPVDGAAAVDAFCRKNLLPAPLYVGSGYGVHVYWPLDAMLRVDDWRRYARGLANLCARDGLVVDTTRTADIASVLRTPGTHNRKFGNAQLVRAGEIVGPYAIEQFAVLIQGEADGRSSLQVPILRGAPRVSSNSTMGVPEPLTAAAANIYVDEPRFTEPATRGCRQLQQLAVTRGRLPEPSWYACLGVLAYCEDGEAFAHHWSGGYPGYTFEETQGRIERAREFGPTTCAKFESLDPGKCAACPFRGKITSPIQLGKPGTHERAPPQRIEGVSAGATSDTVFRPLPAGFTLTETGLYFTLEKSQGARFDEIVTRYPVWLDSVQTGEVNEGFSLAIKLQLPREKLREIVVPAGTLFSSSGMSEMAASGVMVHNPELFRKFIRESVDLWNGQHMLDVRYDQFGWKDEDTAFLFGSNLYAATGIKPVIGSEEVMMRSQYLGPRKSGSLGGWSAAANKLFAKGHEVQAFALLASFAAPLMRFHTTGEGGAIVSLVSDKSGTGKTTALEAAASVWGRLKGTQIIDDDTQVAKGLKLGVFGNMACTYDELYNRDPEVIRKFVLMFTNGRDKDRGTVDGTLRHVRAEWQTILLLASNNSIVDILSSVDGTDAPAYRVLEFIMETPADLARQRGDQLKQQLDANSGHAADTYLRALVQPATLAYLKDALPKWTDQVWQRTGLTKEHRFWVRTISSVIAAGAIVRQTGILDFSVDRIASWAIEQVQDSRMRIGERRTEVDAMVAFLDQHIADTLVVQGAFKRGPMSGTAPLVAPRRHTHVRFEMDTQTAYVEEAALKKWLVAQGVNIRGFMYDLQQRGVVRAVSKRMTLGAGTVYSRGQVSVIEVDCGHPAMSGHLRAVETIVQKAPVAKVELRPRHPAG